MKKALLIICLLCFGNFLLAQPGSGFNRNYSLLHSGNIVSDKNFYLFTVLQHSPEIQNILKKSEVP